jgi:hypothetical protein
MTDRNSRENAQRIADRRNFALAAEGSKLRWVVVGTELKLESA